jgi:hypothetical protein
MSLTNIENTHTPTPIIPQKRQKTVDEREETYEFRANPYNSTSSSGTRSISNRSNRSNRSTPISTSASAFTPASAILNVSKILSTLDIKTAIQNAISPLIDEIKELKEKIK